MSNTPLWVHFRVHKHPFSFSSSQCDYSLVQTNFTQLQDLCKASWEQLKILDKAEEKRRGGKVEKRRGGGDEALAPEGSLRHRLPKILKECEERLKVLRAVHRRVINRCACSKYRAYFMLLAFLAPCRGVFNWNWGHASRLVSSISGWDQKIFCCSK